MASSAKKSKPIPIVPPALRQAIALMFGPGRTITLAVFVLAVFAGGTVAVWRHVEKHVEGSADYRVGLEQIKITPQPEWVRCDVRAEAFRTASPPDRPLSILDDSLAERIRTAFMLHPWVASATVKKRAGARVDVDIGYRRPVCMVEVAVASTVELLPVDGEGVYLPGEDFSPKEKESYPCLAGIDRRPIQPVGHRWGDGRVVDGAAIAAALFPVWQRLKLYRIQAAGSPSLAGKASGSDAERGLTYELYTRLGTRIIWGNAAGGATVGEPTAADKVARLVQFAAAHGSLDAGAALDVRRLPPVGAARQ